MTHYLVSSYSLLHVIEGHSSTGPAEKQKEDNDSHNDIWACEFEPKGPDDTMTSDIMALCGANNVLMLDVAQGRYVKKYSHPEPAEVFYCLAWTTLTSVDLTEDTEIRGQSCNILAVAGRIGSIKLLNPLQNECYRYLFGHQKEVLKLTFSKSRPRWLFSASADMTVRLWDIGTPTSKDDDSICFAKFTLPSVSEIPCAVYPAIDLSSVIVGCSNGTMARYNLLPKILNWLTERCENRDLNMTTVTPTMIYPRGDEWHEGYVDDVYIIGHEHYDDPLDGYIVSRGSDDMEVIVWDPKTSKPSEVDIAISLRWPWSEEESGLRFKIIKSSLLAITAAMFGFLILAMAFAAKHFQITAKKHLNLQR
ncbi:WD40-repeat-containing domain protein [Radiomyces spectabilis]|uniref:WD40-repeat-containing domain protein n=1 Tax=Radiomyces spectabilis TaxID=64574 RepID=UPI00221F8839|nr:WD40-repeat-containing domain protein [Radiomyces spectabilis]KAI8391533.1 WD40-repeat-containing domain protein [Radiomyces spectabilis]